jgi:molybdenum cofactor synthesis domain-containing protein
MTDPQSLKQGPKIYTAAIIIIGNEILSGRTADSNTAWIADKLAGRGTVLREVRIIPDEEDVIIETVNALRRRVDYLFTTGGIGPTHDDITAACVAGAFDVDLELNPQARQMLEEYYGNENVSDARLKMAMIPKNAKLIENPVSGAPGFALENVYVMAGVPKIMQAMFVNILSMLKIGTPLLSNTLSCALQESVIAPELGTLQDRFPDIEIGSYPHYREGVLGLSLVMRTTDNDKLNAATTELIKLIRAKGAEPKAISISSTGTDFGL